MYIYRHVYIYIYIYIYIHTYVRKPRLLPRVGAWAAPSDRGSTAVLQRGG